MNANCCYKEGSNLNLPHLNIRGLELVKKSLLEQQKHNGCFKLSYTNTVSNILLERRR